MIRAFYNGIFSVPILSGCAGGGRILQVVLKEGVSREDQWYNLLDTAPSVSRIDSSNP